MAELKLIVTGPGRGKYARDVQEWQKPMAFAATMAFREGARQIQQQGRSEIAGAGFSRRWQTGFRVFGFPRRQYALDPAIKGTHRIGFANVFERGANIRGKPLLWVPLPTAPAKINGKRTTPRALSDAIGGLRSVNRPGKPPLLVGDAARAPSTGRRVSLATLRTGAARRQRRARTAMVPLFVGIRAANVRARFDVSAAYDRVRGNLGALYLKHFRQAKT